MINLMMIGENVLIPNNNYDMPMTSGEIGPILGSYVAPTTQTTQIAYAFVSY